MRVYCVGHVPAVASQSPHSRRLSRLWQSMGERRAKSWPAPPQDPHCPGDVPALAIPNSVFTGSLK